MPSLSEEAMTAALVAELCSGRKLMETRQHLRERSSAMEANAMRGHKTVPGFGKALAVIPQHEWFLLRKKYGADAMHDRGFIKDYQRHEPSMKVYDA